MAPPMIMTTYEHICADTSGYVLGWGPINERQEDGYLLQMLQVRVIDNEGCGNILETNNILDSHMCAISPVGNILAVSTYINLPQFIVNKSKYRTISSCSL